MDRVKRVIHCDRAYKMGLNGKNITVAVMDTGRSEEHTSELQSHA